MKIIRLHLPLTFSERSKLIFLATDTKPKVEVSLGESTDLLHLLGKDLWFISHLLVNLTFVQTLKMLAAKGNPGANSSRCLNWREVRSCLLVE